MNLGLATLVIILSILTGCKKDDGEAPSLMLNGEEQMVHYKGEAWVDPGYSASDNEDGDITSRVTVDGVVGEELGAIYELRYSVSDAAGNFTSKSRYVTVVYRNTAIEGTYDIVEYIPTGNQSYSGTVTASVDDDDSFVFGSVSASPSFVAIAKMSFGTVLEITEVIDGDMDTFYSGDIDDTSGDIVLTFNYRRKIGINYFDCTAVYTKQ